MSEPRDERLIESLVRDLTPVRRVMRLRVALLLVLGTGAALAAATLGGDALTPELARRLATPGVFPAVVGALAVVALGGIAGALAATRPDRTPARRGAALALAAGFTAGIGACLLSWLLADDPAHAFRGTTPLAADLACLRKGLTLGALPLLVALWLARRGAPRRTLLAAGLAGAGAVALGALTVHLACHADALRHILVSHVLAPGFGALLALPLAGLLRRTLRRATTP